MNGYRKPAEIVAYAQKAGVEKVSRPFWRQFLSGVFAGLFIGLAAFGASVVSAADSHLALNKVLSGVLFATGLMFILIAGGDLFTGNCLISATLCARQIKLRQVLINWLLVYLGNFAGAIAAVLLLYASGAANENLSVFLVECALKKTSYNFFGALSLGILCNILVSGAVWLSYAAKSISGKIAAIVFPITLFYVSGFEHSVANMFYIPMALLLKKSDAVISAFTAEQLGQLNIASFLKNLVPVTLGNILGGAVLVGCGYYLLYAYKAKQQAQNDENLAENN